MVFSVILSVNYTAISVFNSFSYYINYKPIIGMEQEKNPVDTQYQ